MTSLTYLAARSRDHSISSFGDLIVFDHLRHLLDDTGLYEHAWLTLPRREHGYTTDDVARCLLVLTLQERLPHDLQNAEHRLLTFLSHAILEEGRFHNRLSFERHWTDEVGSDDCSGRAIWALGTVAARGRTEDLREAAGALFTSATAFKSPFIRSNAYAILGASAAIEAYPREARSLLERCIGSIDITAGTVDWPWPESKLTYDNARIPEALMAAGSALESPQMVRDGLDLLLWLVDVETMDGRFSFTPVAGRGLGDEAPAFDQQPIDAWAMADACARAYVLTVDSFWKSWCMAAAAWFLGANDGQCTLYRQENGGCADGLTVTGPNLNQGAESTLSALGAFTAASIIK